MLSMKTIKQPNSWTCMAAVAAMITGETVEHVVRFIGHDGSGFHPWSKHPEKRAAFSWLEMARYLLSKGYTVGVGCTFEGGVKFEDYDGQPYAWAWVPKKFPAYVEVDSQRFPGAGHVVYWDGEHIRDPNPAVPDKTNLDEYKITGWWPVFWHTESTENDAGVTI